MAYVPPAAPYYGPVLKFTKGSNLPIIRIVIHYTAGPGQTCAVGAQGTARYFRTDPNAGGSAHYITDLDETIQCAYDNVICWHAPPNQGSLGIEMECSGVNGAKGHWTQANHIAMMHRTAKLTAQKCIQYGIPIRKLTVAQVAAGGKGVCGHVDVSQAFHQSTHTDPGPYFPWSAFMGWVQNEANIINGTAGDQPMSAAEVKTILDALAGYEASTGAEGQRYAAVQEGINTLIRALNAADIQADARSLLAGQRWSQTQDTLTALRTDTAALTTAVTTGNTAIVAALNDLKTAVGKLAPPVVPPKA